MGPTTDFTWVRFSLAYIEDPPPPGFEKIYHRMNFHKNEREFIICFSLKSAI